MTKIENVLEYYVLTNKLKDIVRTGWKYWNIKKERLESVAEHIYGTCMLAIAIWSETLPTVNLAEVLMTLAIHETEEVIIGDLTFHDKGYENKKEEGQKAVEKIFGNLFCKEIYTTLIKNFDEQSTPEAKFAYKCDKLECDLQAKLYDEMGYAKYEYADENLKKDPKIIKLRERGARKVSTFFNIADRPTFEKLADGEEDMFLQISKYIEKNSILTFANKNQEKKQTKTHAKKQEKK